MLQAQAHPDPHSCSVQQFCRCASVLQTNCSWIRSQLLKRGIQNNSQQCHFIKNSHRLKSSDNRFPKSPVLTKAKTTKSELFHIILHEYQVLCKNLCKIFKLATTSILILQSKVLHSLSMAVLFVFALSLTTLIKPKNFEKRICTAEESIKNVNELPF